MRPLLAVASLALLGGTARAECTGPYSADQLINDYQALQMSLRVEDNFSVLSHGERLAAGVPCLTDRVSTQMLAGVYRAIGVYAHTAHLDAEVGKWFRTSIELEPTFEWGVEELAEDSPVRPLWAGERGSEGIAPTVIEGMSLIAPDGGSLTLDGRAWTDARATPDRYHLLQLHAADGSVRRSWLITGAEFPSSLVGAAVPAVADNDGGGGDEGPVRGEGVIDRDLPDGYLVSDIVAVQRERPPMKTPSLLGGGTGLLGAAAIYGATFWAKSQFDASNTEADLLHYRGLTNSLVLASGGMVVLGGAVTYWGVTMSENGFGLSW